jgi:hypothetical protein
MSHVFYGVWLVRRGRLGWATHEAEFANRRILADIQLSALHLQELVDRGEFSGRQHRVGVIAQCFGLNRDSSQACGLGILLPRTCIRFRLVVPFHQREDFRDLRRLTSVSGKQDRSACAGTKTPHDAYPDESSTRRRDANTGPSAHRRYGVPGRRIIEFEMMTKPVTDRLEMSNVLR